MRMPNVCPDRKFNGLRVECLRRRRPAHTARVLLARVFSYRLPRVERATWKELADASRERLDVRGVEFPGVANLPKGARPAHQARHQSHPHDSRLRPIRDAAQRQLPQLRDRCGQMPQLRGAYCAADVQERERGKPAVRLHRLSGVAWCWLNRSFRFQLTLALPFEWPVRLTRQISRARFRSQARVGSILMLCGRVNFLGVCDMASLHQLKVPRSTVDNSVPAAKVLLRNAAAFLAPRVVSLLVADCDWNPCSN